MQQDRNAPLKTLGLTLAAVLATSAAHAHQTGDVILRFSATGTHLNDDPYRNDDSWQTMTGARNNPDFSLKLKDSIAPTLGVTWMFKDAFGLNLSWGSYRHNLRGRYHGTDPDFEDYNRLSMARMQHHVVDIGALWYPLGAGSGRFHPYLGLATTYTRAKSAIHRDWARLEHAYIDEDLADGLITSTQAESERKAWDQLIANSRAKDTEWGWKSHVGADFSLTEQWLLNAQVGYVHAATNLRYWNWTVGLGFKF